MNASQTGCRRCGTCCQNGGPALHLADLPLIRNNIIALTSLITLRKGELAHNPRSGKVQATQVELIKITGKGRSWECRFYNSGRGCAIYNNRPLACKTLECWNPENSLALVEKDVLTRLDIVADDNPLKSVIRRHDELCPCTDLAALLKGSPQRMTKEMRERLEGIVRWDLQIRGDAVREFGLDLQEELFYFGRPYFQLLRQLGLQFVEAADGLHIV